MTNYWLGDIPTEFTIDPARNGEPIDAERYPGLDVTLVSPAGIVLDALGLGAGILGEGILGGGGLYGDLSNDGTEITLYWPTGLALTEAGLWCVRVTLKTQEGGRERVEPEWIVVQDDDGWQTLEGARREWVEARNISDLKLWRLLDIAKIQVLEFAPELDVFDDITERPPVNYAEAQLMQAHNIWNAGRVSPSGDVGGDNFAITPFPLDWQVKQLLRPRRAIPIAL